MIETPQRDVNDCLRACLATVLDLPYDDVPAETAYDPDDPQRQMKAMREFLAPLSLTYWQFSLHGAEHPLVKFGNDEPRWHLFPPGYWLATVTSPRTGLGHVVVMKGARVEWDPHPGRAEGHRGFKEAIILMPA